MCDMAHWVTIINISTEGIASLKGLGPSAKGTLLIYLWDVTPSTVGRDSFGNMYVYVIQDIASHKGLGPAAKIKYILQYAKTKKSQMFYETGVW